MSAVESQRLLGDTGWRILEELQEDAQVSLTELGRRTGLSIPAVTERVRRLEDAGYVTGYRAVAEPAKVGPGMQAVIRMTASGGRCGSLARFAADLPDVLWCVRVTGTDSAMMRFAVESVAHLEQLIDALTPRGDIVTSIVLSTVVRHRTPRRRAGIPAP